MTFADLAARLQPAVVKSRPGSACRSGRQADPFEEFFRRFGVPDAPAAAASGGGRGRQPRTREAGSLGSGFIISADGYVVTNNHVIQGADGTGTVDSVTVTLTDRTRISGADHRPRHRVRPRPAQDRGPATCPSSTSAIQTRARVGDWVVAIGNPYGLGGTVTAGIISALHRGITGAGAYDRYIQTDASHQHGQFAAARCSTSTATSSASTRR